MNRDQKKEDKNNLNNAKNTKELALKCTFVPPTKKSHFEVAHWKKHLVLWGTLGKIENLSYPSWAKNSQKQKMILKKEKINFNKALANSQVDLRKSLVRGLRQGSRGAGPVGRWSCCGAEERGLRTVFVLSQNFRGQIMPGEEAIQNGEKSKP